MLSLQETVRKQIEANFWLIHAEQISLCYLIKTWKNE